MKRNGREFILFKERLSKFGNIDYKYIKAEIYKENFLEALKYMQDLDGYDLLLNKLQRFKSSLSFYNYIQKSEVFTDIFEYYKPGEGLIYGSFANEQDRFNFGLEELGIRR